MSIGKFEDLVARQKVRDLTRHIYRLTRKENFSRDFGLREQVQRSSVSIMSNLAEGFERGSSSEFHQFIIIAKASCAELRSQLYVALDAEHVSEEEFRHVSELAVEVSRIIGGLKVAVRKPPREGLREKKMKIEYSDTADAIYVSFKEAFVAKSKEIEEGVVVDLDENGHLIGIEILDVSERYTLADIANVNIENMPLNPAHKRNGHPAETPLPG